MAIAREFLVGGYHAELSFSFGGIRMASLQSFTL